MEMKTTLGDQVVTILMWTLQGTSYSSYHSSFFFLRHIFQSIYEALTEQDQFRNRQSPAEGG